MKPALELAVENYQRLRDEAAAALALAQKELVSLRNTLATLEGYRDSMQEKRRQAEGSTRAIASLQMDTHFAGRIENAIKQQQRYIEHAQARAEHRRQTLLAYQKRVKAVELILRQRAEAAARQEARRERLETDELASIRHLNHRRQAEQSKLNELDMESHVA